MRQDIIFTLAQLFTGSNVVSHSAGLAMGGLPRRLAQDFFEARTALGLSGYPSHAEAQETIRAALAQP